MAGQLTIDTLKASSGVLATQNGMTGIAKAWVNFNGTASTITSSFNVSSITKFGTGQYGLNFTTAMPNANYCCTYVACNDSSNFYLGAAGPTSTSQAFMSAYSGGFIDVTKAQVVVFSA
jgi:hypothetical protein